MASNVPDVPNDIADPIILRRFLLDLVKVIKNKPAPLNSEASVVYSKDEIDKIIIKINEILN